MPERRKGVQLQRSPRREKAAVWAAVHQFKKGVGIPQSMAYAGYSEAEIQDCTQQKRVERLKKKLVIPSNVGADPLTRYEYLEKANYIHPVQQILQKSLYHR